MKTLQQATASLDATRRSILYNLLKDRHKDENVTEEYILQEMEFYLNSINEGTPLFRPKPQEGLADAEKVNDEFREYEIDVYSVYNQLNHISQQINQHQKLNESILSDIKMKVKKSYQELIQYDQLLRDNSIHGVYFESFLDSNQLEKDERFYTDRDGTSLSSAYINKIDVYKNVLKLPLSYAENAIINFSGLKLANIKITKQLGSGFIRSKNPEYAVDKAFDSSMETFWSESILVDSPLEVDLGVEYYGIKHGAAAELEISFDYITNLNEITFTPFTEYPMEIVAILAYTTDNEEERPMELVSPTQSLSSKESADIISYQFNNIAAKRLRIIINQKHYVKQDILMEVDDKSLVDAWLSKQGFIEVDASKIFKPVYQDLYETNPIWFQFNEYLKSHDIVDEIQGFKFEKESNKVQVSKYEYQYGLYNVAINRNEYLHTGLYVTKPIVNNNVHRVTLKAIEEHPMLPEINLQTTSVEYYVTDKDNPTKKDWHPILPTSTKEIRSERLFFYYENGQYKAKTLFNIKATKKVRENGRELVLMKDYSIAGKTITLFNYNLSSIYTMDYIPESDAYLVDFMKLYTKNSEVVPNYTIENFNGVQKGNEIVLGHYPFIDKTKLNKQSLDYNPAYLSNSFIPIKVRLVLMDGQHIDQPVDKYDDGISIMNKTDYFNPNVSLLEPFTGENYQYRVVENKIKFNTELPKGTHIIVEYPYLTGPIRLKIIMRRNLHEVEGLTPFLHEFKLISQSLN